MILGSSIFEALRAVWWVFLPIVFFVIYIAIFPSEREKERREKQRNSKKEPMGCLGLLISILSGGIELVLVLIGLFIFVVFIFLLIGLIGISQ